MPDAIHRPSRRTVLAGGGVVALAVGIGIGLSERDNGGAPDEGTPGPAGSTPTTTSTSAPGSSTPPDPPAGPVTLVVDPPIPEGVLATGVAYLSSHPDESDIELLLGLLPAPDGDVVAAARGAVADDFREGRTVAVDGWVLSVSEVRAAAALALHCGAAC